VVDQETQYGLSAIFMMISCLWDHEKLLISASDAISTFFTYNSYNKSILNYQQRIYKSK